MAHETTGSTPLYINLPATTHRSLKLYKALQGLSLVDIVDTAVKHFLHSHGRYDSADKKKMVLEYLREPLMPSPSPWQKGGGQ